MLKNQSKANDNIFADIEKTVTSDTSARAGGVFTVKCFDKDGNLKWEEVAHNLVVNSGLQDMNTQYFKGVSYTAAWYLGLVTGPGSGNTYAAGDTMATHAGWSEDTNYSGNRKAVSFGTASTADPSVISNSASQATFAMTGTTTIAGAFLTTDSTKGGTTGTLFSVANFQSPGDRSVINGDTLSVTYTFNLDAA
jgi:hypothetical protein